MSLPKVTARLEGIRDLLLNPMPESIKIQLPIEKKFYFAPNDGSKLVMPIENIYSFLTAENSKSCAKLFMEPRKYKKMAALVQGYTIISPQHIPLMRNGSQIAFHGFDADGLDEKGGIHIRHSIPRVSGGIPQPVSRPAVELPWSLELDIEIVPNDEGVTFDLLQGWFERGGIAIGLGSWRGVYGKFRVTKWQRV